MKISKEFRIGFMVVATIVAAFFVINFLRGKDVFNRENEYVVHLDTVDGLKPSCLVYYRGYKAGVVKSVEYLPENDCFEVVCTVSKEFALPDDSVFELYSADIMGGKAVRVIAGQSDVAAASGALMAGEVTPDMVNALLSELPGVIGSIENTLDSVSLAVGSFRMMVDENRDDVTSLLSELSRAVSRIGALAGDVSDLAPDLKLFVSDMRSVSEELSSEKENISSVIGNLKELSEQLNDSGLKDIVTGLSEVLESLNSETGTVGQLLKDGSVYTKIDTLVSDLDSLVNAIKSNPKKYLRLSVF